jgi:hypothetical protein
MLVKKDGFSVSRIAIVPHMQGKPCVREILLKELQDNICNVSVFTLS